MFRLTTLILVLPTTLFATYFYQPGSSTTALGSAYSSAPVGVEDPSFQFYNPASSAYQKGTAFTGNVRGFIPFTSLTEGATQTFSGDTISGPTEQNNVSSFRIGGALFATQQGNDWLHFHIGVTTPWQVDNCYEADWVGRYYGIRNTMESVNIAPGISIRSKNIVLGVSAQIDYLYNKMERAIDFGSIAQNLGIGGALPSQQDGLETLSAHDWAYGIVVGAMFDMCYNLRMGIGYRSGLTHNMTATANYDYGEIGEQVRASSGAYSPVCADWDILCPHMGWAGFQYDLCHQLHTYFSVSYKNWSRMQEIKVSYANSNQANEATELGWHDTLTAAIGLQHEVNCDFLWRLGISYTHMPEENSHPYYYSNDRIEVGVGSSCWLISQTCKLDIGYTHTFIRDISLNRLASRPENRFRGSLMGRLRSCENAFSAQLTTLF